MILTENPQLRSPRVDLPGGATNMGNQQHTPKIDLVAPEATFLKIVIQDTKDLPHEQGTIKKHSFDTFLRITADFSQQVQISDVCLPIIFILLSLEIT